MSLPVKPIDSWSRGIRRRLLVEPTIESLHPTLSLEMEPNGPHLCECAISGGMIEISNELHRLRQALADKEAKLTEAQLEALARSHQLEQLRDLVARLAGELADLRSRNDQLTANVSVVPEQRPTGPLVSKTRDGISGSVSMEGTSFKKLGLSERLIGKIAVYHANKKIYYLFI
ncbi:unnamed protein product [Protopolystoma xenopodis]|uniref:Uncharacterized protein n=1 Tax=Protopolystoma xenopodis TaxID=117903 RepID=A0A448WE58_9PLAT|nr:unnamed protein product [Protopolystoma xenopodis]